MSAALVVIDMQNDFCSPEGGCSAMPFFQTAGIAKMAPTLRATIDAARSADVPVIWVRSEYGPWTTSGRWRSRGAGKALDICRPGTWGAELVEGFVPAEDELVVTKHRYSPFVHTPFEHILRVQERETLFLTGVTTNVCVESTARDAFMRDFRVIALSDCAASYSREAHEAAMWNIDAHFGSVTDAGSASRTWGTSVPAARVDR